MSNKAVFLIKELRKVEFFQEVDEQKSIEDVHFLLDYLNKDSSTFSNFIFWHKRFLNIAKIPETRLVQILEGILGHLDQFSSIEIENAKTGLRMVVQSENKDLALEEIVSFHIDVFKNLDTLSQESFRLKMEEDLKFTLQFLDKSISDGSSKRLELFFTWFLQIGTSIGIERISILRFMVSISMGLNAERQKYFDAVLKKVFLSKVFPSINNRELDDIVCFHVELFSGIDDYSNEKHKPKIKEDLQRHFDFLDQAVEADSKVLFREYITWVNSTLTSIGIPSITLLRFLGTMRLSLENNPTSLEIFDAGIVHLLNLHKGKDVDDGFRLCEEAERYLGFLLKGNRANATKYVMELVDNGMSIKKLYLDVFQSSQYEIGRLWEKNKVSVAQEHFCTATTQSIMAMLYAQILNDNRNDYNIVCTCVGSELHELGMRIVSDFLELDGWNTYYIGANTPTNAIIQSVKENNANVLAISVTLAPHVEKAKEIIKSIKANSPDVKVLVGGYPFLKDPELYQKIGADGFASSADEVNEVALKMISG